MLKSGQDHALQTAREHHGSETYYNGINNMLNQIQTMLPVYTARGHHRSKTCYRQLITVKSGPDHVPRITRDHHWSETSLK
jgi:hypothetical protein